MKTQKYKKSLELVANDPQGSLGLNYTQWQQIYPDRS